MRFTCTLRRMTGPLGPLLIGLVAMAAALGAHLLAMQPPSPKPVTAPAGEFSAMRALALEEHLLGDGAPHPIGSAANARVAERIGDALAELDYAVETQSTFACRSEWAECGSVTNVVTRLPGRTDGPAVLLTAHYDSVPAGPGAGDDMAGVAAILEIARILRVEPPPRNPIIILLSDGEEPALLGAEAFMAEHPWAADVGVVVNLEANGTHGQSTLFETTADNAWLVDAFAAHAPSPVAASLYDEIYAYMPFHTDLTVYEEAGFAGINFAFVEETAHYHTPLDAIANLDPGSLQHHGDNALAAVRAFGAMDLSHPPPGRVVYQDVVPGVVLRWPEPWTIWLALAGVAALLGVAGSAIWRGELPARALLWGLLVLPIGLLAASLLGLALAAGVSFLTGSPAPWYAHPLPMRVALWLGALLALTSVATVIARRAGVRGLFLGVWLWWSVLAALVAWLAPAADAYLLLPTAVAVLVAAVATLTPLRTWPRTWEGAAVIALVGASWFWLPLTLGSGYGALSPDLGPAAGFAVGMAASALAPLVANPVGDARVPRGVLAGAALLIVAATAIAIRVPVYSDLRPQRLNLLHVEDRHADRAFWAIDSPWLSDNSAEDVPETLRHAGRFGDEPVAVLPWSSRHYLVAPAPPAAEPAPAVRVLADDRVASERVLTLQLRSARGGNRLSLYVPQAAGLDRIAVVGTPYAIDEIPVRDGYHAFHCYAQACDGITLELLLTSDAPFTAFVVDATPGLPQGGNDLIRARPTTAVPSGDGDVTLVADQVSFDPSRASAGPRPARGLQRAAI
jgi:hypothetical protein